MENQEQQTESPAVTEPLVAIVVLHFSTSSEVAQKTRRCLLACQQLTYGRRVTICVDNASPDGSGQKLREEFEDESTVFLLNDQNEGFSGGNNLGISLALALGAELVWLLNADALPEPTSLHPLVLAVSAEGVGGAGSKIVYAQQNRDAELQADRIIWGAGGYVDRFQRAVFMRGSQQQESAAYNEVVEADYLPACSLLIPRRMFDEVGLLDESFFLYFEDTDWCMRSLQTGARLLVVPESVVVHDTEDSKLQTPQTVYYYNRSRYRFWWKHGASKLQLLRECLKRFSEAAHAAWHAPTLESRQVFRAHIWAVVDFLRGRTSGSCHHDFSS